MAMDPVMRDPDGARMRRPAPIAMNPDVALAVPAVIAVNPYIAGMRARTVLFHNGSRRTDTNHHADLREGSRRGKGKREKTSQNSFLHSFPNLQRI